MLGKFVQLASRYTGLDEKLQTLESKIEDLSSREADIYEELKVAELKQPGKKRKNEVENWLRNVRSKKNEVQSIKEEEGEMSSLLLGHQIDKLIGEIGDLRVQGAFPTGLLLDMAEGKANTLVATKLTGQAFNKKLNEIWELLMKEDILCIGIYGMGGVGKTTLALHIHDRVREESETFGPVYWITVSQDCSISKLQTDIAKTLKVDISTEDDEKKRAALLAQALLTRKKFVLILDDVWNQLPLDRVGIPIRVKGCKLILTTRSLDVCRRMECQAKVKVEPLSKDEAWKLFVETLGQQMTLSREVEDIAMSMAAECAGLPLGIITMAASMRGVDDTNEWRSVLEELKELTMGYEDMENDVFPILKLSYSRLNNTKLQLCFLCCALYPEDYKIRRDELIRYFIAEGLIGRRKSWQAKFDEGHTILNKLERSCLLETSHKDRSYVKMHDLIRDMALKITKASHPRFMVKAGVGLTEIPYEQEWTKDLDKVSLMENMMIEIPQGHSPRCFRLSTLILSRNRLKRIADSFFLHMHALQLLDLSMNDEIVELPNSISDLENLSALLLGRCWSLKYVPPLGKLEALRELDLSCTRIEEVPKGMDMLDSLKILNMNSTPNLKMIPSGTLGKLSHLQAIRLHCESVPEAEELEGLKELEKFEVELLDVRGFNQILKFLQHSSGSRLNTYFIKIGFDGGESTSSKEVNLRGCTIKIGNDDMLLPDNLQSLLIDRCHFLSCSCLCDFFSSGNARDLEFCRIRDGTGLESLCSSSHNEGESSHVPFQSLGWLQLFSLPHLSSLFKLRRGVKTPPPGTFSMLIKLCIHDCGKIKNLFSNIGDDMNDVEDWGPLALPKLTKLELFYLPELESIYDGILICNSIEVIQIIRCPKLKRIPISMPLVNGQLFPPKTLRNIEIAYYDKEWWESLEWENPNAKDVLQRFITITSKYYGT